jgi:hypothetical protein
MDSETFHPPAQGKNHAAGLDGQSQTWIKDGCDCSWWASRGARNEFRDFPALQSQRGMNSALLPISLNRTDQRIPGLAQPNGFHQTKQPLIKILKR